MPIYEYECKACGHRFEEFQKITDQALTVCSKCHQSALSKLISSTSFQLKGSGWYVTDFRDKGKPSKPDQSGKETSEGSVSSGDTKTGGDAKTPESKETKTTPSDQSSST